MNGFLEEVIQQQVAQVMILGESVLDVTQKCTENRHVLTIMRHGV